jgi:hypothetical protein
MRANQQHYPGVVERQETWEREVSRKLPALLTQLLQSPVYGLTRNRPLPPKQYGVYLFIDQAESPHYVGRVGLTERSRRAGKGFSNFRTRVQGHTQARHNEGTFAYVRTCEYLRAQGGSLAATRAGNCADPEFMTEFRRQCQLVRDMGVRVVEIDDNKLSAVFEIYAATVLGLPQSFAVS